VCFTLPKYPLQICSQAIWTPVYSIASHIDKGDVLSKPAAEKLLNQWKDMMEQEHLKPLQARQMRHQ
jgi:hypothetical protein